MLYTVNMNTQHRTQLYLDNYQFNTLKQKAKRESKSLAQVVREAISLILEQESREDIEEKEKEWRKFFKLAGIGASGLRDVAENHDKYIASDEIKSWRKK